MRRLFLDCETSPNISLSWRAGKQWLDASTIVKERAVCVLAWAVNDGRPQSIVWDEKQNDKRIIEHCAELLSYSDEVVAHNGGRFDLPFLRARCLFHKLPPLPMVKLVDTLRWARSYMGFNSNRLDYIGKFAGLDGKQKVGFEVWRQALMDNDRKALAKLERYCRRDVILLRDVWKQLAIACPTHTHAGVERGGGKWSCPRCGSENVGMNKRRFTAKGTEQQQMQCKACHGYYTISAQARTQYEEAKSE